MIKITVIDFLSKSSSHLNFNKSFLQAIPNNYEVSNFIGNQSHFNLLSTKSINAITIDKDQKAWTYRVMLLFFKAMFKSNKNITVLAFENYLFPILCVVCFPFILRKKLTLVLHNNVPGLIKSRIKSIPFKLFIKIFNPQLICLTKKMNDELNKMGFKESSVWIPHMNYRHLGNNSSNNHSISFDSKKINIVLLGRQAKNFSHYTLPKLKSVVFQNIVFHLFHTEIEPSQNKGVIIHSIRPSQEEYLAILNICDFCFFPDLNVGYRPSGILLDCIGNYCPVIAPKDGHFEEFSDNNIGFFYESKSLIKTLKEIDNANYDKDYFGKNGFNKSISDTSLKRFSEQLLTVYSSL